MGLGYLDAKAPNLLVAYTLLTVATLPLDAVTLCMLGHPASFLQWARSTAYFCILIFKCASLVLMGMLHTKARPTRPIAPTTPHSNSHAHATLNVTHTAARACAALPQLPPAQRTRATRREMPSSVTSSARPPYTPARCVMQIKFALRLRSEPQEEFFGDADQPTARGEYSA